MKIRDTQKMTMLISHFMVISEAAVIELMEKFILLVLEIT